MNGGNFNSLTKLGRAEEKLVRGGKELVRGGGGAGCLGGEPRAPVRSQETGVEEDLQHNVRVLQ